MKNVFVDFSQAVAAQFNHMVNMQGATFVRANVTGDELWMLPLKTGEVNLNAIALQLDKELQQVSKSFVDEVSVENQTLKNKFDIVLHIINVKKEEQKVKEEREANKSKLALLKAEQAKRQQDKLLSGSDEELLKAIQELEKQSQQ